jgi:hypothetical protein
MNRRSFSSLAFALFLGAFSTHLPGCGGETPEEVAKKKAECAKAGHVWTMQPSGREFCPTCVVYKPKADGNDKGNVIEGNSQKETRNDTTDSTSDDK